MRELWTALDATIKAILTIKNCDEATFLETHHVQAFRLSGVDMASRSGTPVLPCGSSCLLDQAKYIYRFGLLRRFRPF